MALQTGARVDMVLTDLITWQETETGRKHILSSSNQHVAALPFLPPLPSPLPQKHSVYIAVPLCTTQHETSSDERANIAFDS